ncbi:sulfotransferase [Salinicola sp. CR57]|uniref:sulfotransferase family protein n=1 Tax=Salinicola sp. CR57 TaxID=1949086 RepID=UPI001300755C|nr:sulfotransferase [Salinicola sp. CR57]
MKKVKPNFICIGSQKAGTSWLYEGLKQHPQVWLPDIKEIHYFDYHFGEGTGTKVWGAGHVRNALERIRKNARTERQKEYVEKITCLEPFTRSWYEAIFDHEDAGAARVVCEVTPEYCAMHRDGVQWLRDYLPDLKVAWIIRDPYERAASQVKMVINRAWKTAPQTESEWRKAFSAVRYKNRANYKKNVPIWDEIFGGDIIYIPYGDIREKPRDVMNRLESFLGLSENDYHDLNKSVHKTKSLELPVWVKEELIKESEVQLLYLEERFGAEFLGQIK